MKRNLLLLLLITSVFCGTRAQDVIIGTGTSNNYSMAFYPYYEDSWWESVCAPGDVGMQGTITSIALQRSGGGTLQCQNVSIYLGHRSTSSYSSTSDWTAMSNLTLVYSGTNVNIGGTGSGWETYTFTTPYFYNGTDNLVVVFAKHATDYSTDITYCYSSTSEYSSLYRYMDDDVSYSQHPGSNTGSRSFNRPNMKLSLVPNANFCGPVSNLTVSGLASDGATVSWTTPAYNPNVYIVQVKSSNQSWNNPNVITYSVADTFLTLTGLNAASQYDVRVANDCTNDTSSYVSASFLTLCSATAALPISENFDTYTHTSNSQTGASNLAHCWDAYNAGSNYSAYPYVYYNSSNANSGNYSLRFYTGTASTYADQYAFLPELDLGAINLQSLQLGLNMRRQANNTPFTLVVGVTNDMNISTFTVVDTLTVSSTTYEYRTVSFSNYTGIGNRVVLMAPKPSSGNNRGYVDDVVLGSNLCAAPSGLTVTAADQSSITLQWTENGSATSWEVEYGPVGFTTGAGTTVTATANPFTVTGLPPATNYEFQVRANCGGSFSDWTVTRVEAATTCVPVTIIPFTENFDSYTHTSNPSNGTGASNVPNCWDAVNTGSSYPAYPYVYYSSSNAYNGSYSLRFYTASGSNYADQIAVLPVIDNSIPLSTLQISFKARSNAANTPFTLVVGEMSGGASSFVPVDTLTISGTTYTTYVVYFDTYTGTGNRIALKAPKPSSGNNRGYVDDIVVNTLSNCRMVSNVSVSDITTTDATVSWQSHGSETAWLVEYREAGDTVWNLFSANSNPCVLAGLSAATTYQVRVTADCGSEVSEATAVVSFTTETCDTADQCTYTFNLEDSYGDGWNSASLRVQQGGQTLATMTVSSSSSSATYTVRLCDSIPVSLVWVSGNYDDECSFEVVDPFGEVIYTTSNPSSGTLQTLIPSCTPPSCPRPSSVTVSDIGDVSATVSWVSTGSESAWVVEYKPIGTTTWIQDLVMTNPYTLVGLTANTQYDLRVAADCGNETSDWRTTTFQTAACPLASQCVFTFNLSDSYGDGWNDAYLVVQMGGVAVANLTVPSSESSSVVPVSLCDGQSITLTWMSGDYDDECSFSVTSPYGETLYTSGTLSYGMLTTFTAHCTQPTCMTPTSVAVSNIGTTSATVSWVPVGNETAWNVEYKPASSTSWTAVTATTTTTTITGLTSLTQYDIRVQADCGGGDLSDWRLTSFNTNACEPSMQCAYSLVVSGDLSDSWDYCALYVQQNGVTVATVTSVGYGATIPLMLCSGVSTSLVFSGGMYDDECGIALYGPDGTQIFIQTDMSYFTTYTFTPDCGTPQPACDPPTNLAVNSITATTATVVWTPGGSETSWNIQYKALGASGWQTATVTSPIYTISGLEPNTQYQVSVQADCGDAVSDWTAIVPFTTTASSSCPAPTNLAVQVDHTDATLTWQQAANTANEWQISYRQASESAWTTVTVTTTSHTLTGLVPNVDYTAYVVAHCTDGSSSEPSNTVTFHTTEVGIGQHLAGSVRLYPNPARESVRVEWASDNEVKRVEVFNVFGQLLYVAEPSGCTSVQIGVGDFSAGLYYVRVTTGNAAVTKRVVVNR